MLPQDDTINKLVNFRINFFLYGPRASGKTYYLKGILQKQNVPYIYLNCTFADKKINFFKHLNHQLDKFLIEKLKKTQQQQPEVFQNMVNFAIARNKSLGQYQQQDDKKRLIYIKKTEIQNVQSWIEHIQSLDLQLVTWIKQIYIFMDNIQQLNVSPNFLTSFYYSCQQEFSGFKIPFIFCGINLPRKIYTVDKPFRNITSFCNPKPTKLMKSVIKSTIFQFYSQKHKSVITKQKSVKEQLQSFSQKLMKQIYAAFQAIQTDLNKIKKISQVIALKVNEIIEEEALTMDKCLSRMINKGQLKDIMRQLAEQGPINDFIVNRRLKENDVQISSSQMTIEYYPMLLLSSIHLADHAQQNQDRRRFKDYKNMKKKELLFDFKTRKHNTQRIISISESLETIAKQNYKQQSLKHHSLDYYGCIQHLKQQKKISTHGKSHSFVNGKIYGCVKQDEVLTFMRKNDLSYSQFTGIYKQQGKR